MVWIGWVTIWLSIGIGVAPSCVVVASIHGSFPPVGNAAVALGKIILAANHGIEEDLAVEAMPLQSFDGRFAVVYLPMCVATKTNKISV